MIPGEIFYGSGDIEMNAAALSRLQMRIINAGDRPVQVGSHVHLPQANRALSFDRATAHGYRLTSRRRQRCASSRAFPKSSGWFRWADGARYPV